MDPGIELNLNIKILKKWREILIPDFSNKLKVLVRFTFKQENFKPKTDQSEMVSGGGPSQHAVRREGEWLHGLLAELAHQDLNEGQDINLVGIGYPA